MERLRNVHRPPVEDALTRFFSQQLALVNRQLFSSTKGIEDLNLLPENARLNAALLQLVIGILKQSADTAIDRIGAVTDDLSVFTVGFEALAEQIIKSELVNDTTAQEIAQIFSKGLEDNLSQVELQREVRKLFEGYENYRVDRITNTVVVGAWEQGTLAAWQGNGIEAKSWLAAKDARTRPSHSAAERNPLNQNIPLSQPFTVGGSSLKHPGDPAGPASQIINCRCTMIPGFLAE